MGTPTEIFFCYASKEELKAVGADPSTIHVNIAENRKDFQPDQFSLNQVEMTRDQAQKLIPEGRYCYKRVDGLKCCPFWDKILDFPTQNNGYCHFLKKGDWQFNTFGLLWDQCKECGINED